MKKALPVLIVALIVSLVASVCFVKGEPTPTVPEFTVKLVEHPYDVPPSYSIDPYTGENVTNQGYHVYNRTIEVSIKNQPFTPYTDVNGHSISLYYNVSMKGHYGNTWNYYPHNSYQVDYLPASGSSYTVVSFTLGASFREGYFVLGGFPSDIPAGGEVDFRVEALAGAYSYYRENWWFMDVYQVNFNGVESGWSNTQTITIPDTSPSASASPNLTPSPSPTQEPTLSPTPTATPTQSSSPSNSPTHQPTLEPSPTPTDGPYLGWIPFAIIAVAIVSIGIAVYVLRKVKRRNLK